MTEVQRRKVCVVLVDRATAEMSVEDMDHALEQALESLSLKDAVAKVSADLSLPRGQVYKAALARGDAE